MKRFFISLAVALVVSVTMAVHAGIFDRLFDSNRPIKISHAEVTTFTAQAIQKHYLNKSKIKPSELLSGALDAIQDRYPEIVLTEKKQLKTVRSIDVQIYNEHYKVPITRMKDIYDVVVALRQVYSYIEQHYTPPEGSKMSDIEYTAVNGMLEKLDPHSYAFTPQEFKEFTTSTEGNFGGLGIVISMNDDGEIVVVSPIDGTPAMRAGIESGDVIMQINDESAINMTLTQAVDRMRGEPNTKIMLRVRRDGEPDLLTFHLVRAIIKVKSVVAHMPSPGIGYLKLTAFNENTYKQVVENIYQFKKKRLKALILDLRNNPGGLLSQAINISDLFLSKGVIVSTVSDEEREVSKAYADNIDITDIPIVVMVNAGSASAAEIVTAALQANGRATVIGRKTFGKGSVQNLFRTPGGGGLKITIAQYLTPGDISIQSVGIVPQIDLEPVYIDANRTSIFKTTGNVLLEKDLDEHIVSKYSPKKERKPDVTIRYYKPYKTKEQLIKEHRQRPVGVFKNDEEIGIAVKLLRRRLKTKKSVTAVAPTIRSEEWKQIVKQLKKRGIVWKAKGKLIPINGKKLKVSLIKGSPLHAGNKGVLTFKAEYPGKVDNLVGYFDTKIAYLRDVEVLFGSFSNSVIRNAVVTLPDSMSWQDAKIPLKLSVGGLKPVVAKQKLHVAITPKPKPRVEFSYRFVEKKGNINGVAEPNEEIEVVVTAKNVGKGALEKGRLLLINLNNNKQVFIEAGGDSIVLKPGESATKRFMVRVGGGKFEKKVSMAVSLYDYKIRYTAGFSLPFSSHGDFSCTFKPNASPRKVFVKKTTPLFASAVSTKPIASVAKDGIVVVNGSCGDRLRTADGYWLNNAGLRPAGSQQTAQVLPLYSIHMPRVKIDEKPLLAKKATITVPFTVSADTLRDVIVFVNGEKVYYKSLRKKQSSSFKDSVTVELDDEYNTIRVVARDRDKERITSKTKSVYYF